MSFFLLCKQLDFAYLSEKKCDFEYKKIGIMKNYYDIYPWQTKVKSLMLLKSDGESIVI